MSGAAAYIGIFRGKPLHHRRYRVQNIQRCNGFRRLPLRHPKFIVETFDECRGGHPADPDVLQRVHRPPADFVVLVPEQGQEHGMRGGRPQLSHEIGRGASRDPTG